MANIEEKGFICVGIGSPLWYTHLEESVYTKKDI
jgi:hypothetical protein